MRSVSEERLGQDRNPWEAFKNQCSLLEKAIVAFGALQEPSHRIFGRGSYYDTDEKMRRELHAIQTRINRIKIPRDDNLVMFAEPARYPPPDRNVRIEGDDPNLLIRAYQFSLDVGIPQEQPFPQRLKDMRGWQRNRSGVKEAWERDQPKDNIVFTCQKLMHDPPIQVIWNTLMHDVFGEYPPSGFGTRSHWAATMNVTRSAKHGEPDRRDPKRCFTFDSRRILLSLDPGVTEVLKSTRNSFEMRSILDVATIRRSHVQRPRYSTLSSKAQRYYNTRLPRGDEKAQDEIVEAGFREQRKVRTARREFDPRILSTVDGYMQMAAPEWQKRRHEASLFEGYEGDLMVACELGPIGAFDNIRKTGLWRVFAPEVQNIFRDEKAANEAKRRIRQTMSRHDFDHMASISPQRWWAVNHAIGSLIWPNHPVLPRGASRLLRPVDAGSPFDPWAE